MNICQPIVYTRPKEVSTLDYCYFVKPKALDVAEELQRDVDRHLRNVLAEDGYRGEIRGRRWHVFRCSDYVLVGFATREFGRCDALGRSIRGYYGVLMSASDAAVPSEEVFRAIDGQYVAPQFETRNRIVPESVEQMPFPFTEMPGPSAELSAEDGAGAFNEDVGTVRCFPELSAEAVPQVLSAALRKSRGNDCFELVSGFNNIEHACSLAVMNAYVDGVEKVIDHPCTREERTPNPEEPRSTSRMATESVLRDSCRSETPSEELRSGDVRRILVSIDVAEDVSDAEVERYASRVRTAINLRFFGVRAPISRGELSNVVVKVVQPSARPMKDAAAAPKEVSPNWGYGFSSGR